MKKSRLLTFLFSFIPGAGEMYLGLMRKGICIMGGLAAIIAIAGYLRLDFLLFAAPVIWFYSFFDTMNLKNMTEEERFLEDKKFMENIDDVLKKDWHDIIKKRYVLFGLCLILLGSYILFHNFLSPYLYFLHDTMPWLYNMMRDIPTFIIVLGIITAGIYLIKGNNSRVTDKEYIEFKEKKKDE